MSALLPIDAKVLNVCAEYGYSTRQFNKSPMVYQSLDYKSCLFLVYQQPTPLENRISDYRNHFTLFTNHNSIVIARTETTLKHTDNDAIINYDIITPNACVDDKFRSKYKNWDISFDKISYKSAYPSLVGYSLLCSGEWWFYDRGIVLNGVTVYRKNYKCLSILIYYEFHINHKVTEENQKYNILASSIPTSPPQQQPTMTVSTTDATTRPETTTTTTTTTAPRNTLLTNILQTNIPTNPNTMDSLFNLNRSLTTSSLSADIIPFVNASSRQIIRQNDSSVVPQVKCRAVVPSLFWLDERCKELSRGNIDYFRPIDYNICKYT